MGALEVDGTRADFADERVGGWQQERAGRAAREREERGDGGGAFNAAACGVRRRSTNGSVEGITAGGHKPIAVGAFEAIERSSGRGGVGAPLEAQRDPLI